MENETEKNTEAVHDAPPVEIPGSNAPDGNAVVENELAKKEERRASESTAVSTVLSSGIRESAAKPIRRTGSTRSSLASKQELEVDPPVRDTGSYKIRVDLERQLVDLRQRLHEEECNTIRLTKQLSVTEDRRVAETSALQSQLCAVQTSLAALRTQLERSEAARQDLELAVAVSRHEAAENERVVAERAARAERERDEMARVADEAAQAHTEATEQHRAISEAQERELIELRARIEEQNLELRQRDSEVQAQTAALQCYKLEIAEKNDKSSRSDELISRLQKERLALKKEARELEASREREATLQHELETLINRVDELVGAVHTEREENARLRAEKHASEAANAQLGERLARVTSEKDNLQSAYLRTTDQISELRSAYADERCKFEILNREYDKLKDDYDSAVSNAQDSARRMTETQCKLSELQRRVNNGDDVTAKLQEELSTARSKSSKSEESCRKVLKHIETLLAMHEEAVNDRCAKQAKNTDTQLQLGTPSISALTKKGGLLERLRALLVHYEQEAGRLRSDARKADHDVSHFRSANSAAQRELGALRQRLAESQNELLTSQREYATLSERVSDLAAVSERQVGTFSSESGKLKQAYDALTSMYEKRRADLRNMIAFEFDVVAQLAELSPSCPAGPAPRATALFEANDESIVALCNDARSALNERLAALREEFRRLNACELDFNNAKRRGVSLEKRVQQLETALVEQETRFSRERTDLEGRLSERAVQDEAVVNEAMQHVANAARVQQQLETELRARDAQAERAKRANGALRFAVALLCSALPRARAKHSALALQKRVLQLEIDRQNPVVNCVMRLVSSLSDTLNVTAASAHDEQPSVAADTHERSVMTFSVMRRHEPLLRFRLGVIFVLAANRLRAGAKHALAAGDAPWLTNVEHEQTLSLFRNEALLADLEGSLGDLVELIDVDQDTRTDDPQRLADLVRVSNDTLLRKLQRYCDVHDLQSQSDDVHSARSSDSQRQKRSAKRDAARKSDDKPKDELIRLLKRGLKPLLAQSGTKFGVHVLRTDELGDTLYDLVNNMRERLARADSLRQETVGELSKLKEQASQCDAAARKLESYEQRIAQLEAELANRVERARFERVRCEFEEARAREIELSELLNTQTASLRELGARLDRVSEFEETRERQLRSLNEQCTSLRTALAAREGELKARADERSYFEALVADRDRTLDSFVRSRTQLASLLRRVADQFETTRIQLQLRALNYAAVSWSPSQDANQLQQSQSRERDVVTLISTETDRLFRELLAETDGRKKRKVDAKSSGNADAQKTEQDTESQLANAGFRQMLLAVNEFVQFLVGKYAYFDQQLADLRQHAAFLREELRRSSKRDTDLRTFALTSFSDAHKGDSERELQESERNSSDLDDGQADKQKPSGTGNHAKPPSGKSVKERGERKKKNTGSTRNERASQADTASRSVSRTRSLKSTDPGDTQSAASP